jgi:hypothetical protein
MAQNSKLSVYIRYVLLFFLTLLFLPETFYRVPETGLDPSWNIAVHLIRKQGLVFGRDFVFTYGPLAIFQSRLPIAVNKFIYLLFDAYFVLSFFLVLRKIFSKHFSFGVAVFAFLGVMTGLYQSEQLWLFFFFLFNLFTFLQEPNRWLYLIQAGLLSILCFYFKMNFGLVIIVFFVASLSFAFFRRKLSLVSYGATLLTYFFLIWISAHFLHVDLRGYITGSLEIIDGYNDAMFFVLENQYMLFLFVALAALGVMACWFLYRLMVVIKGKQLAQHADEIFIYALTAASSFILFKSAFVRANPYTHLYFYFKSIGLLGALLYLFSPRIPARRIAALCSGLVLAIGFWGVNALPGSFQPWRRIVTLDFIPIRVREVMRYCDGVKTYDSAMAALDTMGQLSGNEYKAIIGDHSADIIPTEISTLYFNGIRYDPRPVMQSYSAYNRYLDSLNWQKYVSPGGPDFLLLSIDAIDGRYPFFDETKTKLAILSHYSVAGEIKGDLVLRKKDPQDLLPIREQTTVFKLGQDVPIRKSSDLQYARIFVKYSWLGQLRRLFYQPPALKITFTLDEGETKTFKAIVPILADGVILNKYIETEKEFQLLMQSDGRLNSNIRMIRLEPEGSGGFAPEIKMVSTWYSFPKKSPREQVQDSLEVAKLLQEYDSYAPVPLDTAQVQTDSILCGIGNFADYSSNINVVGWAFRVKAKNDHIRIRAILRSGDRLFGLPSEPQVRPDLPMVFAREDLYHVGFKAMVSKSRLPPGDYQFGVLIVDSVSGEKWITYTDKHVFIRSAYGLTRINPVDTVPDPHHKMEAALNPLIYRGDGVEISGWAFVRDMDPREMTPLVILQSQSASYEVNADILRRQDVAAYFHDPKLEYCGFSTAIRNGLLPQGHYNIGIVKRSANGKDSCIRFTGQYIDMGAPGAFLPALVTDLPPAGNIDQGTDYVKEDGDTLAISGWAVYKKDQVRNSSIDIVLKSNKAQYSVGSERKARPDVMTFFKNKLDADSCGFVARIPTDGLPAGKYELGVHVYHKGDKGAVKFIGQSILIP